MAFAGSVRLAVTDTDASDAAVLLHDFNREFGEPSPPPATLARRLRDLVAAGDTAVLLVGDGPDGVARHLYESLGFTNRTGEDGALMFVYERAL